MWRGLWQTLELLGCSWNAREANVWGAVLTFPSGRSGFRTAPSFGVATNAPNYLCIFFFFLLSYISRGQCYWNRKQISDFMVVWFLRKFFPMYVGGYQGCAIAVNASILSFVFLSPFLCFAWLYRASAEQLSRFYHHLIIIFAYLSLRSLNVFTVNGLLSWWESDHSLWWTFLLSHFWLFNSCLQQTVDEETHMTIFFLFGQRNYWLLHVRYFVTIDDMNANVHCNENRSRRNRKTPSLLQWDLIRNIVA